MRHLVKIFFLLFLFFLFLFFKVEFEVYPHLPDQATHPLLSDSSQLPKQVVLFIVDSLRADYVPRFDFVKEYSEKYPNSTFVAKSKVGNPTMTTQRIESMMTGSEIFSSGNILKTFLASRVDADNIITQLSRQNRTSAVLGDNTWVKLFDFTQSAVCTNTFDVHDLNTCDQVVYDNLPRFLGPNANSSDFIVAHLLGIDHVGHSTSSLTSPKMEIKMKEFSNFLSKTFEESPDQTLFLVTGDHGMRDDGNHGGSSKQEVETFIFAYLKGADLFRQKNKAVVAHSDLTTTLSVLLGIPLPNNAIGYPILDMLPSSISSKSDIVAMNKNLFLHFTSMLQFYGAPLSTQESDRYSRKLSLETDINDQEIILQFMAQKLTFLKYSAPDPTQIFTLAFIVSLLPVGILIYIFGPQLYQAFTECRPRLFVTLFCEGLPMFTLFIAYFSWAVIQNLSDALYIGFIVAVVFGVAFSPSIHAKVRVILTIIAAFVFLSQIEPDKSNDYKPSIFRLQLLNTLVTSKWFWASVSTTELVLYLHHSLPTLIQTSHTSPSSPFNQQRLLNSIKILIAILSFTNYICTHILQAPFYTISIIQTTLILIYAITIKVGYLQQVDQTETISCSRFLVINLLSVFMGPHFPLVLAVCLFIQGQMWSCYNYAVMMSLLSKCVWWWLGNRYQYSGVDILKTYVYSQSYAIALNAVSLVLYLNSPFILNLALLNWRMLTSKRQGEGEAGQESSQAIRSGGYPLDGAPYPLNGACYSVQFVEYLQGNNMKFCGVLLLGLVSSIWTTLFNNQKILFTVVCVPVLVLITLVSLTTLLLVVLLSLHYESKLKPGYQQIGQQS